MFKDWQSVFVAVGSVNLKANLFLQVSCKISSQFCLHSISNYGWYSSNVWFLNSSFLEFGILFSLKQYRIRKRAFDECLCLLCFSCHASPVQNFSGLSHEPAHSRSYFSLQTGSENTSKGRQSNFYYPYKVVSLEPFTDSLPFRFLDLFFRFLLFISFWFL